VPRDGGQKLNPDIATRLALVHEFRTRSRVFISTEAGAKGLNLQFCDTVVNYDLPLESAAHRAAHRALPSATVSSAA